MRHWRVVHDDDGSTCHAWCDGDLVLGYVWEFDHASYPHTIHAGSDERWGAFYTLHAAKDRVEKATRPN